MEHVTLRLDAAETFDRYMKESRDAGVPEYGDLEIVVKPGATQGGKSGVMVTFTVDINGKRTRVQAVTTLAMFAAMAGPLRDLAEKEQ